MGHEFRTVVSCAIVVLVWLFTGTVVYRVADNCSTDSSCSSTGTLIETPVCGWSTQESFYYSVQAGLSIGFGLLSESKDGSRLYTVFHILLGSSLIGGALAFFVGLAITRHSAYRDTTERQLAKYAQILHKDGHKGFTLKELRGLMVNHPTFYRDILEMVDSDHSGVAAKVTAFRGMNARNRLKAADAAIEQAHGTVDTLHGGKLSIDDFQEIRKDEMSKAKVVRIWLSQHASFVTVWSIFFVWMLMGILFGICTMKWSFIQSLYFAVTTCSTAGLQGVDRTPDGWEVLFAGVFALVGVPLYGAALGTCANIFVDRYNEKVFNDRMNDRFEAADVEFVEHINGRAGTDSLDLAEFTEIQLLKLGIVDRDLLTDLRDQFAEMDTDGSGRVEKDVLIRGHEQRIKRINTMRENMKKKAQNEQA